MKKGKYYSCLGEFLENNKTSKTKKFLLIAEYSKLDFEELQKYDGEIAGAIVPFVVYNDEFYNKGLIACELDEENNFLLVKDLTEYSIDKELFLNTKSLIIMIDGLSSYISEFLDKLFENVPENTQIIGGGAGKMTFEREPVIFNKNEILKDAALIITLKSKLYLADENGWEFLSGPYLVTNSEKNLLKSLNFKNAFEVYKEIVEKDCGKKFADDNFFDLAKSYPVGIVRYDKKVIVRDPIYLDKNNNLVLVGPIEKNSIINILKGEKTTLIDASKKAILKAKDLLNEIEEENSVVLFDCISRAIYLGDDFIEELKEIKKNMNSNKTLFGALTLGEIINNGNEYIVFYNKSCVIGLLC